MAAGLKPSELLAEFTRLQQQVSGLADSIERIIERLAALEAKAKDQGPDA